LALFWGVNPTKVVSLEIIDSVDFYDENQNIIDKILQIHIHHQIKRLKD
jgi:hypothetical protein